MARCTQTPQGSHRCIMRAPPALSDPWCAVLGADHFALQLVQLESGAAYGLGADVAQHSLHASPFGRHGLRGDRINKAVIT